MSGSVTRSWVPLPLPLGTPSHMPCGRQALQQGMREGHRSLPHGTGPVHPAPEELEINDRGSLNRSKLMGSWKDQAGPAVKKNSC